MENPTEHQHSSTLKSLKTVLKHVETSKQWSSHGHPFPLRFPTGPSATGSEGTLNGSNPTWTARSTPSGHPRLVTVCKDNMNNLDMF